jgi:isoleucyl-tRNA synthetase
MTCYPAYPEGPTPQSSNLLDRWILARLNQVAAKVVQAIENSDPLSGTLSLEELLGDITNWYVRRSRRRFWKSDDKNTAYATLYHLMVKLIKLLAPFIPFMTEAMYQNLVCNMHSSAYLSVHHTRWPETDQSTLDKELLEGMALARQVASLGLSARNSAGLKVRQPLARAIVYAGGKRSLQPKLLDIVIDELNVKVCEFVEQVGELVSYRILPDNKTLGPRFGSDFPKVRAALAELDPDEVATAVNAGLPIVLEVQGVNVEIEPDAILVQTEPAEGLAIAADKLATVAVDATLTPELRAEGLAREVVRRIQAMRKNADFDIADRITTYYQVDQDLVAVIETWGDYIMAETLTTELVAGPVPDEVYRETHKVDGNEVHLGIRQNT